MPWVPVNKVAMGKDEARYGWLADKMGATQILRIGLLMASVYDSEIPCLPILDFYVRRGEE